MSVHPPAALTVKQFAVAVGLSPTSVRRRISDGRIRVSNVGSRLRPILRIRASEVDRYLSTTEVGVA